MPKCLEDESGSNSTEYEWMSVQKKTRWSLGTNEAVISTMYPEGNCEQYTPINELYLYKPQKVYRHF